MLAPVMCVHYQLHCTVTVTITVTVTFTVTVTGDGYDKKEGKNLGDSDGRRSGNSDLSLAIIKP